ncbi:MAG: M20/M25/M40 family metallo-hydrolase [Candidatus Promineifilaceae bacterium]
MKRLSYLALLATTILVLAGCSILQPPIRPTIPVATPVTVVTLDTQEAGIDSFESTIEAVGAFIEPSRDPDTIALMNNASSQQLIAYVQALQDFGTRNSFSETQREDFGIGAARRWIFSEFERVGSGRLEVRFEDFPFSFEDGFPTTQRNVVATLPGVSDYPGVIVIGAHYDTRLVSATDGINLAPAADDNGSGVAMILELARLMSSRTWNQTIVFVAFAAEEQKTAGSRYFVQNGLINGMQIDHAISADTVGGRVGIPQSLRVFAENIPRSLSGQTVRYAQYLNQLYMPEFPLTVINALDRDGRYGDQREFVNAGIGAIRITESIENPDLLNCPCDTWEKLDYEYLRKVVQVNLVMFSNWAGAPKPPPTPSVAPMAQEGTYLVTWNKDLQAAGYAVSFRSLDALALPPLRYVSSAEAGNTIFSDLDPLGVYAVSIAPISASGRLGGFSKEIIIPQQ